MKFLGSLVAVIVIVVLFTGAGFVGISKQESVKRTIETQGSYHKEASTTMDGLNYKASLDITPATPGAMTGNLIGKQ